MTLDDAIFNWLQIKYVAEQRSNDRAAQETFQFFSEILRDDFKLENLEHQTEDGMCVVHYQLDGEKKEKRYPTEFVHQLLLDIESEPKYNT